MTDLSRLNDYCLSSDFRLKAEATDICPALVASGFSRKIRRDRYLRLRKRQGRTIGQRVAIDIEHHRDEIVIAERTDQVDNASLA